MAAIPTVLYIGDDQVNGGAYSSNRAPAGLRASGALGGFYGIWQHNYKFSRVVPSGADGFSGGSFDPYWDGSIGGTGAWVKFHYAPQTAGINQLATNGDNWMESTTPDGTGAITPTPMLMNKLWERYPGGFKLIKYTIGHGFGGASGFNSTGNSYIGLTGSGGVVATAAAALPGSDTLDIKAIVADCAMTDLFNVNLTYKADAQSFLTGVRAALDALARVTCAATTPIVLVNPHEDSSPNVLIDRSAVMSIRADTRALQAENEDVYVFDMNWAKGWKTGIISLAGVANQPGEYPGLGFRRYYGTDDYVEAGLRIGNFLEGVWAEVPQAPVGAAIPVVAMIGDSQFVGVVSNLFIDLTRQPSMLGDNPNTTVRSGQWIWNAANSNIELYDALANSNTYGTVNQATFGPDATLLKKLGQRFPDGVVVWKYARNGVALTTEANGDANGVEQSGLIWPDMMNQWALFKQECLNQLGRSPDLIGIVTDIGGNDASTDLASTAFQQKVGPWVDDLRQYFSTRAIGGPIPIVYLQPPPPVTAGGNSIHNSFPSATMTTRVNGVRSAIAALATSKPRLRVILNNGDDDYELVRPFPGFPGSEPVHYGGEALLQIGYDLYDELVGLLESDAGGDGAAAGGGGDEGAGVDGPPSEGAAFTIETGAGLAAANSYTSVEYATTYHETYGNPAAWLAADLAAHQDALRQATRALDIRYGTWWSGVRVGSTQALDWPRAYVYDQAGNAVPTTTIPTRLQQATAILALLHIQGESILPSTQTGADIRSETLSSASGASKSVTYIGGKRAETQYPIIDRMLATGGLTSGGAGWGWLDL